MTQSNPETPAKPYAEVEVQIRMTVQQIADIAKIPLTPEGLERGVKLIKEMLADGRIAQIVADREAIVNAADYQEFRQPLDIS
jgi:hypothetical protein